MHVQIMIYTTHPAAAFAAADVYAVHSNWNGRMIYNI